MREEPKFIGGRERACRNGQTPGTHSPAPTQRDTDSRGHVFPTASNTFLSSGSRRSFPRLATPHHGGPGLTTMERGER
jgi:hypothetical protein